MFFSLGAVDLTKDTPIESLHTLLLGIGKYSFTVMSTNFLDADQVKALEGFCRGYHSRAFSRNLNSSMRLYKSFLGRDFKIMMQVLPIVLKLALKESSAFGPFRTTHSAQFEAMFACFDKLGELISLVYMERIKSNLHFHQIMMKQVVKDVVAALEGLHHIDVTSGRRSRNAETNQQPNTAYFKTKNSLANRGKSHNIIHFMEDFLRFAGGVHTETEKGEQFNKYIRNWMFLTNRQNMARDVCFKMAIELIHRNITQEGTWNDGRSEVGSGVKAFLRTDLFNELVSGTVELPDNNFPSASKKK